LLLAALRHSPFSLFSKKYAIPAQQLRSLFRQAVRRTGSSKASGSSYFVFMYLQVKSYTPSDFLIPKMRRRIPLKSLGLRKETTFILSPPNKSFCTEPRQTAPAGPPTRRVKTAPEKSGPPKARRRTQSRSFPCCFPGISQTAPSLRKMEGSTSKHLSFPHAHFQYMLLPHKRAQKLRPTESQSCENKSRSVPLFTETAAPEGRISLLTPSVQYGSMS